MPSTARVNVQTDADQHVISRHLYGQFAEHLGRCIYEGLWVGEDSDIPNTRGIRDDVVEALKKLNIPNLRWPGGCYADEYHWRDGIGPRDQRPRTVNSLWGGVVETNEFGTHEFLDLCERLDTEPYLAGNVGSGSPRELKEWVQYLTYDGDTTLTRERAANGRKQPWKIKYFGIGNENWGCGGSMCPNHYANLYRQFAEFARNYSGNELYRIACGANNDDTNWTDLLMERAKDRMHGLSLHYYTTDWHNKGSATDFDLARYGDTLWRAADIDRILGEHSAVMDKHDPEKKVGMIVDEWGTWFDVEPGTNPGFLYQQNTIRDALVAGVSLNILHRHADRVHMANIAQMVNVLQAMVLTDGPRMLLTPTYHVFEMYKVHQDATHLPTEVTGPHYRVEGGDLSQLNASASRANDGTVHVSFCNLHHDESLGVTCELGGGGGGGSVTGRVLTGDSIRAMNSFDQPETVQPTELRDIKVSGSSLTLTLPPHSVAVVAIAG